jgi:hypothetical protein
MKIKILAFAACLFIPFQWASADIAADFKAGMSMDVVMAKAVADGMSIEDAVAEMVKLHPEIVALIVKEAVTTHPDKAGSIVAAATTAAPQFKDAIVTAAIEVGADPQTVLIASSAGFTAGDDTGGDDTSGDDTGDDTNNTTTSTGGGGGGGDTLASPG